jgi:ribosome biogenesis protein BRX1
MAPVIKALEHNVSTAERRKGKRKAEDLNPDGDDDAPATAVKKKKNKQRVLLLSSRGITHRMRHLMNDLEALLPHVKKGLCLSVSAPRMRIRAQGGSV